MRPTNKQLLRLIEHNTVIELAEQLKRTRSTIYNWLKDAGWQAEDTSVNGIGCPECSTNPRARGLCTRCYGKAWR